MADLPSKCNILLYIPPKISYIPTNPNERVKFDITRLHLLPSNYPYQISQDISPIFFFNLELIFVEFFFILEKKILNIFS